MNYTVEFVTNVINEEVAKAGNQSKLAERVGLDKSSISKWKRGVALPSPETFFKYFPDSLNNVPKNEPIMRPVHVAAKPVNRVKKPAVETIYISDHKEEMMDAFCGELRVQLREIYKGCYVRVGSMDYHNILVISIEKVLGYGRDRQRMFFRKVYPDPIDHIYLDKDWLKVVKKNFITSADSWIIKQFKS